MRKPDLKHLLALAQRGQHPTPLPLASLRPPGPFTAPEWLLPNAKKRRAPDTTREPSSAKHPTSSSIPERTSHANCPAGFEPLGRTGLLLGGGL